MLREERHENSNDKKCQMTQNYQMTRMSNDTNVKCYENDMKYQMTWNVKSHMTYDTWQAYADARYMTPNARSYILRSVSSSPGRSFSLGPSYGWVFKLKSCPSVCPSVSTLCISFDDISWYLISYHFRNFIKISLSHFLGTISHDIW